MRDFTGNKIDPIDIKMVGFTLRLPPTLKAKFFAACDKKKQNKSMVIRELMRMYVKGEIKI